MAQSSDPSSFERVRPHFNVGTVGHLAHGKTTLVAAITRVLAAEQRGSMRTRARSVDELPRGGNDRNRGAPETFEPHAVEYETAYRHYAHFDCPGRRRGLKNVAWGAAALDAAVLVVSAVDAAGAQTREHVFVARSAGARDVVVFLNKCDLVEDPAWLDEVEREVREALDDCGVRGDEARVVRGSALLAYNGDAAWQQPVRDLVAALDRALPEPARDEGAATALAIECVYQRTARPATAVTGKLLRGTLERGDVVMLVGDRAEVTRVRVEDLEVFDSALDVARAGDYVGVAIRAMNPADMNGNAWARPPRRGHVLATPGSLEPCAAFTAEGVLLTREQGGRHTPIRSGHRAQFYLHTADVTGRMTLADPGAAAPGERFVAEVELARPVALWPGLAFSFRDGCDGFRRSREAKPAWAGTAGTGVLTRVVAASELTRDGRTEYERAGAVVGRGGRRAGAGR